ncbi:MAG: hypothetical protein HF970_01785 [ANME-2 cluster archaeon]|nr:hypothetical protein [ANME-2 cluster archaeon]
MVLSTNYNIFHVHNELICPLRPHTVIEKQHVRLSQISRQIVCGCSAMRAATSGGGGLPAAAMAVKIYNLHDGETA